MMRFPSWLGSFSSCAGLVLAASLPACTTEVVSGIGSGGSGGGASSATTASSGGEPPGTDAIAFRFGDLPALDQAPANGVMETIDPDSTMLIFESAAFTCGDALSDPCDTWRVRWILTPAQLTPGTLDIATLTGVVSSYQGVATPPGSGQCGAGFDGNGATGTLEILSVDATSVAVQVTGFTVNDATPQYAAVDIEGPHTAQRCPGSSSDGGA